MKIKSGLITQASGSLGGMTASRNRGGMYLRARAVPVNPNTSQQRAVRQIFGGLATIWQSALTDEQRDGWDVYGVNVEVTDRLGDARFLTGINHFVRSNTPRIQAGLSPVLDAPGSFNLGILSEVGPLSIPVAGTGAALSFDDTDPWVDQNGAALLVYASRPYSPAINYFKGPFRFAASIAGNSASPPTTPAPIVLPFPVQSGARVTVQVRATYADGRLTSARTVDTVVA